jgi:carbamoyltransferase
MLLGMGYCGEGKTMGLASYGQANPELNKIREHVTFLSNGKLELDNRGLFLLVKDLLDRAEGRLTDSELFHYKADIAYAHQKLLEEMVLYLCNYLYKISPSENLCLAGGVALNSVANYKILQKTPFKNIFIQPAAGDAGIAIGAALYGAHAINNLPRSNLNTKKLFSPFLGKSYKNTEACTLQKNRIKQYRVNVTEEDLYTEIAKQISNKKIIGWFNGRSEIGPRALGARSILADPREERMKDVLNQKVKHRENFRPFAPAILEEEVGRYFENISIAPYMLLIANVKENAKDEIPATIHVDNTARVQTVNAEMNPDFYSLIHAFYLLTGVPVILNTSFNLAGKPIVETPGDAIDCFLTMSLDGLYLDGDFYLKSEQ